jgi:hypothetical protein
MWKKIVKALTDLKVLVGTPTHHCARFAAENVPLEPQANGQGVKGAGRRSRDSSKQPLQKHERRYLTSGSGVVFPSV